MSGDDHHRAIAEGLEEIAGVSRARVYAEAAVELGFGALQRRDAAARDRFLAFN